MITVATHLVAALDARDWDRVAELVTEDLAYLLPQSREHTQGREAYLRFNRQFPGDWTLEVLRSLEDEQTAMIWFRFTEAGQSQDAFAVHDLHEGKIARITEYWPDPYDPPSGRSHLVERW